MVKNSNLIHNVFVTNERSVAIEEGPTEITTLQKIVDNVGGRVARMLINSGGALASLRTNDVLRKDQWKELDQAMVDIARVRLTATSKMRELGLVKRLSGGLGAVISQYETISDMTPAEVSMSGVVRTAEDIPNFNLVSVPIPVISKDFRINIRHLMASRRAPAGAAAGESIDTTTIRVATRKVAERFEEIFFNGYSGKLDGNSIYGLTTHPQINLLSGSDWGTAGQCFTDILSAIGVLHGDRMYGPYGLFVAPTQFIQTQTYISNVSENGLTRIGKIPNLQFVQAADQLADGTAVLFQLTADVIDIAMGEDMTVVQWDEKGGLELDFKVMMAGAPRPKADAENRSGIVLISGI